MKCSLNPALKKIQSELKPPYICQFCGKTCIRKYWLAHMICCQIRRTKYQTKCQFCNKTYKTKRYLKSHYKVCEKAQLVMSYEFECNFCDAKFERKKHFTNHITKCKFAEPSWFDNPPPKFLPNHPINELICYFCDKSFKKVGNMQRHFDFCKKLKLLTPQTEFILPN